MRSSRYAYFVQSDLGHLIPYSRNFNQLFMHAKKEFNHKPCVPESKHILWQTEGYVSLLPHPKQLPQAHTGINLLHAQFQRPNLLDQFMSDPLSGGDRTLLWDPFYDTSVLASAPKLNFVSLECLVRNVRFDSQIAALSGSRLKSLEPNIRMILKDRV